MYKKYVKARDQQKGVDAGQASMESLMTSDTSSYGPTNPRQKLLTSSLVNHVIVNCGLPMSIVDDIDFKTFIADLDPHFKMPCRQTVSYSILPRLREAMHDKVTNILQKAADVGLTTDIWTDRRAHSFLAVTAHTFLDGKPNSLLLSFQAFEGSHTGEKIAEALESVISEAQLGGKVRYVVTDNASNMRKAMSVLFETSEDSEEYAVEDVADPSLWEDSDMEEVQSILQNLGKRISCFAHSLQLLVRDGLSSLTTMRLALGKCSKLANMLHQSALFRGHYESVMGTGKSVPSTNETRWNSTYRQLKAIAELDATKLTTVLNESNQQNLILSSRDMNQIKELVRILSSFAEATDLTQGSAVITISCIVPTILSLIKKMNEFVNVNERQAQGSTVVFSGLLRNLTHGLYQRFQDIFAMLNIPLPAAVRSGTSISAGRTLAFDADVFLMACALDPEYAYHWLQDMPTSQEEKQAIRHKVDGNKEHLLCFLSTSIL